MERPIVSIITPAYNSAAFIAQTITSVQSQTCTDWEMLITDDCSTDGTIGIINNFIARDSRIRLFTLPQNAGPGVARNHSISQAKGRYIAFLDADDLWMPEKLEKQIRFMEQSRQHVTFSFYDCMDESGVRLPQRIEAPKNLSYRQLFFCNYVGNLTGIYDSDYFGKIPISPIKKRQDWIVWLTVFKKLRHARPVPESLAVYRVRTGSVSSSKLGLLWYNYAVYRQFHRLNVAAALGCMAVFLFVQLLVKPRYVKKSE
ncbi:glycosyl transferase [Flavobacterium magnum]|uniref:Glycosyl transferase n=1 Tax=Flavobacterium magnum TaxID=2162713 RepID=A0A2S0RC39_9FLAO|nr:glycosyltransferase family 2 protein [Flavobacterium magnum]AWA29246.1 glycosyl transferase [Flavobacterium magnum]